MIKLLFYLKKFQGQLIYVIAPFILTVFIHFPIPWGLFKERYKLFPILADFGFWFFVCLLVFKLFQKVWSQYGKQQL